MTLNPFRYYSSIEGDYERYSLTLDKLPSNLVGRALDLGVPNPFTPILRRTYPALEIRNAAEALDFDCDPLPHLDKSFDAIFSFEVLEHLMNPLWNLLECRRVLKENGTIYLTTPKGGFPSTLMWPDTHFHEIDAQRLHVLARSAGLRIERMERFNASPFYFWRMGIFRPTLRVLFGGWFYVEMEKGSTDA